MATISKGRGQPRVVPAKTNSEPHQVIPTRKLTLNFQELVCLRAPYFPDTKGETSIEVLMMVDGALTAGIYNGTIKSFYSNTHKCVRPTHWCYLDGTRHPDFIKS